MRRVFLTLLAIVLTLAVLGAVGFVGYQYGYRQGALAAANGGAQLPPGHPDIGPRGMDNFGWNRGFGHGFGGGFGFMRHGMGFGFLWSLMLIGRILFWALVIGAIYWLLTRSGWRLTRETAVNPTTTTTTYTKVEKSETDTE